MLVRAGLELVNQTLAGQLKYLKKMQILSSVYHPHAFTNLYDLFILWNTKGVLKNVPVSFSMQL